MIFQTRPAETVLVLAELENIQFMDKDYRTRTVDLEKGLCGARMNKRKPLSL